MVKRKRRDNDLSGNGTSSNSTSTSTSKNKWERKRRPRNKVVLKKVDLKQQATTNKEAKSHLGKKSSNRTYRDAALRFTEWLVINYDQLVVAPISSAGLSAVGLSVVQMDAIRDVELKGGSFLSDDWKETLEKFKAQKAKWRGKL